MVKGWEQIGREGRRRRIVTTGRQTTRNTNRRTRDVWFPRGSVHLEGKGSAGGEERGALEGVFYSVQPCQEGCPIRAYSSLFHTGEQGQVPPYDCLPVDGTGIEGNQPIPPMITLYLHTL